MIITVTYTYNNHWEISSSHLNKSIIIHWLCSQKYSRTYCLFHCYCFTESKCSFYTLYTIIYSYFHTVYIVIFFSTLVLLLILVTCIVTGYISLLHHFYLTKLHTACGSTLVTYSAEFKVRIHDP